MLFSNYQSLRESERCIFTIVPASLSDIDLIKKRLQDANFKPEVKFVKLVACADLETYFMWYEINGKLYDKNQLLSYNIRDNQFQFCEVSTDFDGKYFFWKSQDKLKRAIDVRLYGEDVASNNIHTVPAFQNILRAQNV